MADDTEVWVVSPLGMTGLKGSYERISVNYSAARLTRHDQSMRDALIGRYIAGANCIPTSSPSATRLSVEVLLCRYGVRVSINSIHDFRVDDPWFQA